MMRTAKLLNLDTENVLSKDLQLISHLKIKMSFHQLVHSHRGQAGVSQEEGGKCLIGSEVFFHREI